jgi:DNA-binding LytR/AlgR family response regulator
MPSLNGIDFYREVKQNTMVIFTTAHMEYAVEGFNLNALDYLLKPYSQERFLQAAHKARDYFDLQRQSVSNTQDHMYIRADYSLIKIDFADIVLIESLRDYMKIVLANGKHILARMTMKTLIEKLPAKEFVRVHRSFIVPLSKVKSVRNKVIFIHNTEIPIGNSYEADFFERFKL